LSPRYSARAIRHLNAIFEHIAADDSAAAARVIDAIRTACDRLVDFPRSGRAGLRPGTRECSMPRLPYIIVYRYDAATGDLGILAVFHARRNRSS